MSQHHLLEEYTYLNNQNNQSYHLVRGCIPQNISAALCGQDQTNLMITVGRESYENSPLIRRFNQLLLQRDILRFYWYCATIFITLFLIQAISIYYLVKYLITIPIENLRKKIIKNDLPSKRQPLSRVAQNSAGGALSLVSQPSERYSAFSARRGKVIINLYSQQSETTSRMSTVPNLIRQQN